jgi:Flp pilus assembly protein TadD
VDADPNDASAQAALGALLVQVRETEPALPHLTRAIELNPRELTTYVNRGKAYLRLGRRAEGEADLRKAISFDPAGEDPNANRARGLLRGTIRP